MTRGSACGGLRCRRTRWARPARPLERGRAIGLDPSGGGIDPGEDPKDAARRETRDETGYDVAIARLLGIDSLVVPAEHRLHDQSRPLHSLRIIYRASVAGGELANEVGGSTDEARWFPSAEVPDLEQVGLVEVGLRLLDS